MSASNTTMIVVSPLVEQAAACTLLLPAAKSPMLLKHTGVYPNTFPCHPSVLAAGRVNQTLQPIISLSLICKNLPVRDKKQRLNRPGSGCTFHTRFPYNQLLRCVQHAQTKRLLIATCALPDCAGTTHKCILCPVQVDAKLQNSRTPAATPPLLYAVRVPALGLWETGYCFRGEYAGAGRLPVRRAFGTTVQTRYRYLRVVYSRW